MTTPENAARSSLRARRRQRVGVSPVAHLLPLAAVAAAALLAAATASAGSVRQRLESPQRAEIARSAAAIPETTLASHSSKLLRPGTYWGGVYAASTGEQVTVYVSGQYPEDPAVAQRWADFLASLVHGPELSSLVAYLAPQDEVSAICGQDALACYGAQDNLLVAPGDDPTTDTSAEAVVTHEYGHHVAAHRTNAPWVAVDYGTKRWATYEQVCANSISGQLYPGAESLPRYRLNPGEAFAETYRVLNERLAGIAEAPWEIVSQQLYPDDAALAALRLDVTSPWQTSATTTRTATLTKTTRVRSYSVATPLDGTVRVTLRAPAGARVTVELDRPDGTVLTRTTGARTLSLTTTVCGSRTVGIRVSRVAGAGTFRLAVDRP